MKNKKRNQLRVKLLLKGFVDAALAAVLLELDSFQIRTIAKNAGEGFSCGKSVFTVNRSGFGNSLVKRDYEVVNWLN